MHQPFGTINRWHGHQPLDTALVQAQVTRPHDRVPKEEIPERLPGGQIQFHTIQLKILADLETVELDVALT